MVVDRKRSLKAEEIPPWTSRSRAFRFLRSLYPPNLRHILRNVNTDQLCSERLFLRKYPLGRREWGVVFPHGMGDLYMTCSFAQAVLEQRGGSEFAVFVRPHHAYIPTLFPAITRIVPVDDFNLKRIQQNYLFERGRLFAALPLNQFVNVIGYKDVDVLDYCRLFLKLELGTPPTPPRSQTPAELERARALLEQQGLRPGRTILLAPDAVSFGTVPEELWADLAAALGRRGFDVAANSPPGAGDTVPGARPLEIPVDLFIAVATEAGHLIAMRSGLCDLVAHADCRLTVVYADEPTPARRRLFAGFSLRSSGLRPDAQEVWCSREDPHDAVDRILAAIPNV